MACICNFNYLQLSQLREATVLEASRIAAALRVIFNKHTQNIDDKIIGVLALDAKAMMQTPDSNRIFFYPNKYNCNVKLLVISEMGMVFISFRSMHVRNLRKTRRAWKWTAKQMDPSDLLGGEWPLAAARDVAVFEVIKLMNDGPAAVSDDSQEAWFGWPLHLS